MECGVVGGTDSPFSWPSSLGWNKKEVAEGTKNSRSSIQQDPAEKSPFDPRAGGKHVCCCLACQGGGFSGSCCSSSKHADAMEGCAACWSRHGRFRWECAKPLRFLPPNPRRRKRSSG